MLATTYVAECAEFSGSTQDKSDQVELIRSAVADPPGSGDSILRDVGSLEPHVVEVLRRYVERAQAVCADEEQRALRYPISVDKLFNRASG
jgi:hypothetical protein